MSMKEHVKAAAVKSLERVLTYASGTGAGKRNECGIIGFNVCILFGMAF